MEFTDFPNFHEMLRATVDRTPGTVAYRSILENGEMESVTWSDFYDQVRRAARALIALGIERGDKVNVLSFTNYKWVLTDFAVMAVGGCTVGIYQTLLPKDCRYIVDHSDAVLVFAEDEAQVAKLKEIRQEIPDIRKVILFKGDPGGDDWVIGYDEFLTLGDDVPDETLQRRIDAVTPEDLAAIVYTSGTTGVPKGAVLTHDNLTFTAQSVKASLAVEGADETLLFLPLAHVFARLIVFGALASDITLTFARGLDTIAEDMKKEDVDLAILAPV